MTPTNTPPTGDELARGSASLRATRAMLARLTPGRRAVDHAAARVAAESTGAPARAGDPASLDGLSSFVQQVNSARTGLHRQHPFRVDPTTQQMAHARRRGDGTLRIVTPPTIPLPSLTSRDISGDESVASMFTPSTQYEPTRQPGQGCSDTVDRSPAIAISATREDLHLDEPARACAQIGCDRAHLGLECLSDFSRCVRPAQRLALSGYKLLRIGVRAREIYVIAEIEEDVNCCARCGGLALRAEEFVDQVIVDKPVAGKRVLLYVDRVCSRCQECGALTLQSLPSTATRDMTDRLLQWIAEHSAQRPIESLAKQAGIACGGYLAQLVDARRSGTDGRDSTWGPTSGWITPPQLAAQS